MKQLTLFVWLVAVTFFAAPLPSVAGVSSIDPNTRALRASFTAARLPKAEEIAKVWNVLVHSGRSLWSRAVGHSVWELQPDLFQDEKLEMIFRKAGPLLVAEVSTETTTKFVYFNTGEKAYVQETSKDANQLFVRMADDQTIAFEETVPGNAPAPGSKLTQCEILANNPGHTGYFYRMETSVSDPNRCVSAYGVALTGN